MNDEDFYRDLALDVDDAHAARTEANDASPALWQQIRAQYGLEKEDTNMTTTTTFIAPMSPLPLHDHERNSRPSRYVNIAATVAVVAALALGSWFTAMNLGGNKEPEPRWAVVPASPEATAAPVSAQTCDVEPLSIDRVMEIVKNPSPFMANGATVAPRVLSANDPKSSEYWAYGTELDTLAGNRIPTNEQFDTATVVANEYLDCILSGTEAQVWNFYSPAYLQWKILAEFPIYRDEATIRARVEKRSTQPAKDAELLWMGTLDSPDITKLKVNPDPKLAILQTSQSSAYADVMFVGVLATDSDGADIFRTNGTGINLIPNDPKMTGKNSIYVFVTLAKLRSSDVWVVIPSASPAEIGMPIS